jgi:hypothetical protein
MVLSAQIRQAWKRNCQPANAKHVEAMKIPNALSR